eukprot:1247275-Rhodomonas_salina.1
MSTACSDPRLPLRLSLTSLSTLRVRLPVFTGSSETATSLSTVLRLAHAQAQGLHGNFRPGTEFGSCFPSPKSLAKLHHDTESSLIGPGLIIWPTSTRTGTPGSH